MSHAWRCPFPPVLTVLVCAGPFFGGWPFRVDLKGRKRGAARRGTHPPPLSRAVRVRRSAVTQERGGGSPRQTAVPRLRRLPRRQLGRQWSARVSVSRGARPRPAGNLSRAVEGRQTAHVSRYVIQTVATPCFLVGKTLTRPGRSSTVPEFLDDARDSLTENTAVVSRGLLVSPPSFIRNHKV